MTAVHDGAYTRLIDARLTTLHEEGAQTFGALLSGCRGADPTTVAQRLAAMNVRVRSGDLSAWTPTHWRPGLHPLRSEWYFTPQCATALAQRFGARSLACLGAPTVAASASAVLLDHDATTIRARFGDQIPQVIACDLASVAALPLPQSVRTIVADPPWYAPHPLRWLALAANAVGCGGTVAMVLPPELQRPTAVAQRAAASAAASDIGLVQVERDAVRYATPLFEAIAMQAAGIELPRAWRSADLLVLTVQRPPGALAATTPTASQPETFTIGDQLVTLSATQRAGPPSLTPIAGTRAFVWDQVSMRDPRISSIDVWTSRSRVATVRGHHDVRRALLRMTEGASVADACKDHRLATALSSLLDQAD
ncbi:MAG: hypothetical protein JKY37_08130 [Nannocystaceae bacterium]|nr:hypothetical protein [Nannocystaceae bacterium]